MREELAKLRQEKGQVDGMVYLLQEKLQQSSEELFDLQAQMVTIEAEASYKCQQNDRAMQSQLQGLQSRVAFLTEQLQSSERTTQRVRRELDMVCIHIE